MKLFLYLIYCSLIYILTILGLLVRNFIKKEKNEMDKELKVIFIVVDILIWILVIVTILGSPATVYEMNINPYLFLF